MLPIVFAMLVTCCGISAAFREDVFKDGASGSQVVNHVVDLVGQTCLIDNEIFLRRMAEVETQSGTDGQTYRNGYNGGIWNIGQDLFNSTKNNPNLFDEYQAIKKTLNIDWSKVTWQDLRKPIYSGLAASLLMLSKSIRNIPESDELQSTVWSVLRPGNRAFDFFLRHKMIPQCDPEKILDVTVILDFQKLSTFDLVHVETFILSTLKQLPLSNDKTRVAIVTKKLHPVAGWYLNSSRPGFTLIDALKILRYTPGPTTIGDSIKYTRENMFNTANGARVGSARVALLLTDNITQYDYAKQEANKLESSGISLVVVEVKGNGTSISNDRFKHLVSPPSCRNAWKVNEFAKLTGIVDRIVKVICQAPVRLTAGDFDYSCTSPVVARLPDTTDSVSVMVSSASGGVSLYATKKYTEPGQSAFDVHLASSSNQTHTPVLYVRGTDPVYIKVTGQANGGTCNGVFTIHVKQKSEVFNGMNGVCMVAGTLRHCTDLDMGLISHDVVLVSGKDVPNLCDPKNHSLEYFPHPVDAHKFIMCDQHDQAFVGLCPVGQSACAQITSGCKYSNPCTSDAVISGNMSHNDPCGNQTNHIACTHFGIAELSKCAPGRIWNQDSNFCVFKFVHDSSVIGSPAITNLDNPCIHEHADHVYFPYPSDFSKYIFCDMHGNAFANTCRNGHWNQQTKTCTIVALPNTIG